jgi:hypothetical protein
MPRSRPQSTSKQLNQEVFLRLTDHLYTTSEFVSTLQTSGYQQASYLNEIITKQAIIVGFTTFPRNATPLQYVITRLGSLKHIMLPNSSQLLLELFQAITKAKDSEHQRRRQIAHRIGLTAPTPLPIIHLHRLSTEYPPRHHFVLENPNEPIPPIPRLRDPSCRYPTKFHILDESQLAYTLPSDQSAIFIDADTGETIAVVIRDFAKSYFPAIQQWSIPLLRDAIHRRSLSQRNNPGKLARVGVTEGPRHARLFGWARNLKANFRKAPDRTNHDQNISSLFGLFYALLRGQLPWLAAEYEKVMSPAHLPRLDVNQLRQFTIPFPHHPITFDGYPLAPPEGYIATGFCKEIHADQHWDGCPWGSYWNLVRSQSEGKVGLESGASFFIADYGLRIANDSNTYVGWRVNMWHGTGWYYYDLTHHGLAMLLSKVTQTTWEKYKELVNKGELKDGDLFWYPEDEASS